jgi:hypothetical protein
MEVLVALMVFAIAVVGLVAMESRSVEAQKASAEIREAERVAQDAMSELRARSFLELLQEDFEGDVATFPYVDESSTAANRVVYFRRPPSFEDPLSVGATPVPGAVAGKYIVHRQASLVTADGVSITTPTFPDDLETITGIELLVTVLWIDDTNPAYPPPTTIGGNPAIAANLTVDMIDPSDPDFAPFVGSVQLRTLRMNDVPTIF